MIYILADPNHYSRSDEELSRRIEGLLGSSYDTCVSILNLINSTLESVVAETKGFQYLLGEPVSPPVPNVAHES